MQVQSNHSPYKHLVGSPLSIRDRTSLIATILSDQNEVEMIRGLCKDNVQAFVDVVCEVHLYTLSSPKSGSTDLPLWFFIRHWGDLTTHYRLSACNFYARSVANKPYFRGLWSSQPPGTKQKSHYVMVVFQMYGRVDFLARRLLSRS